jgi:hypothetical protein
MCMDMNIALFPFPGKANQLVKTVTPGYTVACGVQSCCGRGPDQTEKYIRESQYANTSFG